MHDQLKKGIVQVDVFLPFLTMVFSWSTCKLYKVWDLCWWEKNARCRHAEPLLPVVGQTHMLTLVICMQDSDAARVCTPARGLPVFQPLLALLVAWSACQLYKTRHLSWLDKMRAFVLPIFYCQWWGRPTC